MFSHAVCFPAAEFSWQPLVHGHEPARVRGAAAVVTLHEKTAFKGIVPPDVEEVSALAFDIRPRRADDLVVVKPALVVAARGVEDDVSDNQSWFDHNKIISSSWTDIKGEGTNFFNIGGHDALERRFFMERNYGGCPADGGWFVAVDEWLPGKFCSWEADRMRKHRIPLLLYSNGTTYGNWNTDHVDVADAFIVFVKEAQSVIGK